MDRAPGLSVRLKLALSYAAFLMIGGGLLLVVVWVFLLRGAPANIFVPVPSNLLRAFDPTNFGPIIFGPAAVVVMVFLLMFGLVGGWFLAGRMIAPLMRITNVTRLVAEGSLSHRIGLRGRQDEFRELADAFDAMLARIEAHVTEQQRFAANASHELRTPLAITQTLLDVARNDPNRDAGELIERLRDVNARAIDLIEALLVLGRSDRRAFTKAQVDLSLIAEEATEALLSLADKHGVTLEISCDTAPVIGSDTLLLQMATNLVRNAIMHNLPRRGTVWIATAVQPGHVMLAVENTGEELSPQSVSTLVEPFQRGSGRIHTRHAGVGMGLAIVKSITEAHGGTLVLEPRPSGGLRVVVQLPAPATAACPSTN